jgi:hypothetical protein
MRDKLDENYFFENQQTRGRGDGHSARFEEEIVMQI